MKRDQLPEGLVRRMNKFRRPIEIDAKRPKKLQKDGTMPLYLRLLISLYAALARECEKMERDVKAFRATLGEGVPSLVAVGMPLTNIHGFLYDPKFTRLSKRMARVERYLPTKRAQIETVARLVMEEFGRQFPQFADDCGIALFEDWSFVAYPSMDQATKALERALRSSERALVRRMFAPVPRPRAAVPMDGWAEADPFLVLLDDLLGRNGILAF